MSGKNGIYGFTGNHRFLSNFAPAQVVYDGSSYPTTEHAYQAAKTLVASERRHMRNLRTPGEAKRYGRQVTMRSDWEKVKLSVMEDLVRQKFTRHESLKKALLNTGDMYLEETNAWGDTFWGVSKGKGENHLGKILMKIRQELQKPN